MRLVAPQMCDFDTYEEFLEAMDVWDAAMDEMIEYAEDTWNDYRH